MHSPFLPEIARTIATQAPAGLHAHREAIAHILGIGKPAADPALSCTAIEYIEDHFHQGSWVFVLDAAAHIGAKADELSGHLRGLLACPSVVDGCAYTREGYRQEVAIPIGVWAGQDPDLPAHALAQSGIALTLILLEDDHGLLGIHRLEVDARPFLRTLADPALSPPSPQPG